MSVVTDPARPVAVPEAAGTAGKRRKKGTFGFNSLSPREKVVRYVLLVFVLIITIGPFLWQLSTSLKGSGEDIYTRIPRLLPSQPTLSHYAEVADTIPVWDYMRNSLQVAVLVVGAELPGSQARARVVPRHAGAAR